MDIGGSGIKNLRVTQNSDGCLYLFGLDASGNLFRCKQASPNSDSWDSWTQITGKTIQAGFVAVPNHDGRIVIAAVETGSSHHVFTTWQQSNGSFNGVWQDLGNMGGTSTKPTLRVGRNSNGLLEFFGKGNNGYIWHSYQRDNYPDSVWTSWADLGGKTIQEGFVVTHHSDGRLVVIGVASASPNHVFNRWQDTAGGWEANWNDKGLPSGVTFDGVLTAGITVDGRMQYFAQGSDNNVWSSWINFSGNWSAFGNLGGSNISWKSAEGSQGSEQVSQTPLEFKLLGNYPNPFNPATKISYQLPSDSYVTLKVYDILGREVSILVNNPVSAGSHTVEFNASNLPSGVYVYRLQSGSYSGEKKLVILK